MSLSSALSNALTGLNASALSAELIANNVANAQTPGYTRRAAELSAVVVGGSGAGVEVSGVRLYEDPAAIASRRRSDAALGAQAPLLDAAGRLSAAFGAPGEGGALATLAGDFETALLAASNDPASEARLAAVMTSAQRYTGKIAALSTETQRLRMDADAQIARQVSLVNDNLKSIEMLNREIQMLVTGGGDASALIDARKALIDEVSSILPIRAVDRANGAVALFSANGATLLDGPAAEIGFTPTPTITQDMTLASGALSGLTLNGQPIAAGDGSGPLDGGSLGALFSLRDTTLPAIADQLDALAEDVILRFQDPGTDPTLGAGDSGLFTDAGAAYNPADRAGIAARIEVSAAVDPARGGALWRLRDGIGAAAPGPVGDGALLQSLETAATGARTADPVLGAVPAGGMADFAAALSSQIATREVQAETESSYLAAINRSLRDAETAVSGVNTDREMQQLLIAEQAYAANAKVMSVVDGMLRALMEI